MKSLVIFCFCLISIFSKAQQLDWPKPCSTDSMWNEAVKRYPSAIAKRKQLQDFTTLFKNNQQRNTAVAVLYIIPVVFHVIHTYGYENISKEQIVDAVDILNKSFQKLNPDTGDVIPLFQPIFADCQIQFRLANIDPQGNCTDGITRTYSPLTNSAGDNVKDLIDWPSDQYLNIWVVKNIESGAAGYAYYPGINPEIDGIVMLQSYVGSTGTSNGSNYSSRSLTHEVGHWLDLPHTWGSSNTPGLPSNCGIDDGISDTPNTVGVGNFSCNTAQNTCGQIDNVQNYMDYASCHKMFTEGQKSTMHAALNSFIGDRENLWTQQTLTATGTEDGHVVSSCAPVADMPFAKKFACTGEIISFSDCSWNGDVTSRLWTFNGGNPATDTSAIPSVSYSTPGVYDVTLTVANANGSSTVFRQGIIVISTANSLVSIPASEGFESLLLPGSDWVINNDDNNNGWQITNTAAASGTKSAKLINYSNNSNSIDELITEPYNLSNVSAPLMTFKVAYASKNSTDISGLYVSASYNCGKNWTQRYQKIGATLQTTGNPVFPSFTPNSLQWRTESLILPPLQFGGNPSVRFKFKFVNDAGNNIYIDDINISEVVGINEILADEFSLKVWPNPSSSDLNVRIDRKDAVSISLELYDAMGRKINSSEPSATAKGNFEYKIQDKNYSGVYTLRIKAGEKTFQRKVMFIN